jgi:hypothetical protein
VYSANRLQSEFHDIVEDPITSVCLDERMRRFLIGTVSGKVTVRQSPPHCSAIAFLALNVVSVRF